MKQDLQLLYEVGSLRFLKRTWSQFLTPEFANTAEHTLRVIWISLVLGRHEESNRTEALMKMALIEDLCQSRTGDINGMQAAYTTRDKKRATQDILGPTSLHEDLLPLWEELEAGDTLEAKIIKDADYLDMYFELKEQEFRGSSLNAAWKEVMEKFYARKLQTKSGRNMLKELETAGPLDWYFSARS